MSAEELRRAGVLSRVGAGELKQLEAAEWLGLSYRQTKRLWQRYRQEGAAGLVHGNVGQRSHHAKPEAFRRRVLSLVRRYYSGEPGERFGPTLAAEHLTEDHGLAVDAETLRRWMVAAGLWSRERKRKPYRKRRPRKAHFGELVQLDGSFHQWLEGRGPRGCLVSLVDDATGVTLSRFVPEETTWAVADLLRAWVETYGIPRGLYADFKTVLKKSSWSRLGLAL
jgi:transposase